MRRWKQAVVVGGFAAGSVLWAAGPAGANVVTDGTCVASGVWQGSGQEETSEEHDPSDVITIPQTDVVAWEGGIDDSVAPGDEVGERAIKGKIEIQIAGRWYVVDDWDNPRGTAATDADRYDYDLPDFLIGIEIPMQGNHSESGAAFCEGNVTLVVAGDAMDNPLFIGALALAVISLGLLFYAGRARSGGTASMSDGGSAA